MYEERNSILDQYPKVLISDKVGETIAHEAISVAQA